MRRKRLRRAFRRLAGRRQEERAVEHELEFHIAMTARELEDGGLPADEARREAERRFGDRQAHGRAVREIGPGRRRAVGRRQWRRGWMQDVGFALRGLRRRPLFSAGASTLLGLGVAACAVVFSFLHAILVEPLPLPDPGRLVRIEGLRDEPRPGMSPYRNVSLPDVEALAGAAGIEASAGMMTVGQVPLTGMGLAEMIPGARVAPDFFRTVGVPPRLGRPFEEADGRGDAEPVVILGHGAWLQRFGGDPDVLGRPVTLDHERHVVVGVMPPGFAFPADTEVWLPLRHSTFTDRFPVVVALARLEPGADRARVEAAVAGVLAGRRDDDAGQGASGARVTPLHSRIVEEVRPALLMLGGAALIVLLVVSANLGGLLLGRASSRRREMAIRRSLGAGRERVRRLLGLESLFIGLAGGVLGILLTAVVLRAVVAWSPPDLPFRDAVGLTPAVVLCGLGLALVAGLVSAILPVRSVPRAAAPEAPGMLVALRGPGRAPGAALGVAVQVALATMLVMGAGLLLRSFWSAVQEDPGVRVENVLTAHVTLPGERYRGREAAFFEELLSRLERYEAVEAATLALFAPLRGAIPVAVTAAAATAGDQDALLARVLPVDRDYFRVLGVPLLRGRTFAATDDEGAPRVAVVSRTAAARLQEDGDPIGRSVHWAGAEYRVVGVVGDVRQEGLLEDEAALMYVPFRQQQDLGSASVILRTAGDPGVLAEPLRGAVASLERDAPVDQIETLSAHVSASLARPRFYALLVGAFGGLTLVLAVAGLYAVILLMVQRRIFELGLRAALGARPRDNLLLVMGRGLATSGAGVMVGLAAGLVLSRAVQGLLYEVEPTDPLTVVAAGGLMFLASFAAVVTPALVAARVDPLRALRGG